MKLPRDLSGTRLIKALSKLGYVQVRQIGSHIRLSTSRGGNHHVTVPLHDPVRIGTLSAIISDVADHHGLTREQVLSLLVA